MTIKTTDEQLVKSFIAKLKLPGNNSHKGQNGKILIIGGSSLFHAASLWAAEVASHFCDMVHYSSTVENEKIFLSLKKKFRNGIVVPQAQIYDYANEDDTILVGPGMMRDGDEGKYTLELTLNLIKKFPEKRFVFDAGALQMMDPENLLLLKQTPIITPHQNEFEKLFGISVDKLSLTEKVKVAESTAKKYHSLILLKAIVDIVSDGHETYIIEGGNSGLTKGGTGDVLSSLCASFYTKNSPLISSLVSSILLKKSAEELFYEKGYWYNVSDIINRLPRTLRSLI